MTYASIEEVWGGVSGSNQLTTPLGSKSQFQSQSQLVNGIHPIHMKRLKESQIENFANMKSPGEIKWKTANDLYKCNYGTHKTCNQVFDQNQQFNNEKKNVAAGVQNFLPGSPSPQNYAFSPQYPWYPWAKQGYMMYGPEMSNMWYGNPWGTYPNIANQIAQNQLQHGVGMPGGPPYTKTGYYYPQGFMPLPPQYNLNPSAPAMQNFNKNDNYLKKKARRENFSSSNTTKTCMIYFIFFLVALAVILCVFIICMACNNKK